MPVDDAAKSGGGERVPFESAGRRRDRRAVWLAAAAVILSLSTLVALNQEPAPDPYSPPGLSLEWFFAPIEVNPEQRLPAVGGEIRALWSSADGERVWAVGEGGLVLRSVDGGARWNRVVLAGAPAGEQAPPRGAAAAKTNLPWQWELPGGRAEAQGLGSQAAEPPPANPKQQLRPPEGAPPEQRTIYPEELEALDPSQQQVPPSSPSLDSLESAPPERNQVAAEDVSKAGMDWHEPASFVSVPRIPPAVFSAVHFLSDGMHGWIGSLDGIVLRTVDGGESWTVRLPSHRGTPVVELFFKTETVGCALLGDLDLAWATTTDSGSSWHPRPSRGPEWTEACGGIAAARGDLDEGGLPRRQQWLLQTAARWRATMFEPRVVFPFSNRGAWLAGKGGRLAVSHDEGARWRLTTRASDLGHKSLYFLDERRGLAGGRHPAGGYVAVTSDGGLTWNRVLDGLDGAVVDLDYLVDEASGAAFVWALTSAGELYRSSDGGKKWQRVLESHEEALFLVDMDFFSPSEGLGVFGSILSQRVYGLSPGFRSTTRDGGANWAVSDIGWRQVVDIGGNGPRTSGADDPTISYLNADNYLVVSTDREPETRFGPIPVADYLQQRGERLWIGGSSGLARASLARVDDDGKLVFESLSDSPVSAFFFLDDRNGWRAEPGGGLHATTDGGLTWTTLTHHAIYPAPWYWLAVLFGVALLVPAVAPPPAGRIERSIAEMAVSDQPIGPGDPDPLGFDKVARGLSRFLRNTATRPPLTIAVLGEWGTGKSSLMNLVKADLVRYGFRPVWFNAWHHQKEEQLLAALLENIRRQAVPSWLRPEGWIFRGRLLGERLRRWFVPALLVVLLFGVVTGWVAQSDEGRNGLRDALALLNPLVWTEWLANHIAGTGSAAGAQPPQVGWLVSVAGVGYMLFRGLRAFGIKPAQLAAGLSEHARVRDIEAQTGFRYRFSREFADVTRALSPRTLTVMIDDLDRCRPQNVLEVLEAVNFLVSSGECYVLLGIDRDRVERCVGYGFREVADEILDSDAAAKEPAVEGEDVEAAVDEAVTAKRRRAAFARQYLEKLINIEVPVPRVGEQTGAQLLQPPSVPAQPPGRWHRARAWSRRQARSWWLLPAMLPLALGVGLLIGSLQAEDSPPVPQADAAAVVEVASARTAETDPDAPAAAVTFASDGIEPLVFGFTPGRPASRPHLWLWSLAGLLVIGVGVWVLTTLPEVEVRDSPEFLAALRRCYPLLHDDHATPRSVKRFLNRVRFYAMGQRPAVPPRTRLTVALEWLARWRPRGGADGGEATDGAPPTSDAAETEGIPEEVLVALTAVQHTHPEWLEEDDFWRSPNDFLDRSPQRPGILLFSSWARYRDTFEHLSSGVESR